MKILLVPPTHHYATQYPCSLSFSDFPSGFGYLAASLKQAGHEVVGVNPNNILGYPSSKLMLNDVLTKKLLEAKPDLVGFGGICTDYAFLRDAIQITRKAAPKTPIVLGGQIVTNDAEFIFQDLKPDYAIIGEAENILVGLVNELAKGAVESGILKGPAPDLDELPFPDYEPFGVQDMLDHHSHDTRLLYRYSRADARPFNIVVSRGCPFRCTFCIHGQGRDMPYRGRSLSSVIEEIRVNYERYKFNVLIILDELFVVKNDRFEQFCNAVLDGKQQYGWDFDWVFQTHASAKLTLNSLKLAKKAGCYLFSYGLESASPTVLKSMNKRIDPQQVVGAIALAREAQVGFSANLIFGDPAETEDTWAESLAFWLRHGQDNFIFLGDLRPYPGSAIFDACCKAGLIQDKHTFYDTIDTKPINMTRLHPQKYLDLLNLTTYLERTWMLVKQATEVKAERDGAFYRIKAQCPYCHAESTYKETVPNPAQPYMLGVGCQHCQRRIRVDVKP